MSNLRRPLLEIPSDAVKSAAPEVRTFVEELNASFRTIGEQHEASAGLRGSLSIKAQTKKEERGTTQPGLKAGANRIADAADPVDDQDALTLGYLMKWLTCERLVNDILSDCMEWPEIVDNGLDPDALPPAASSTFENATFTWAQKALSPEAQSGSALMDANNEAWAFMIQWPVTLTVSRLTFGWQFSGVNTKLGVGLYDLAGNLVVNFGTFTSVGSNTAMTSFTFTPVTVAAGEYYLAFTSDTQGPSILRQIMENRPMANLNRTREGKGTATVGGALNSTLGTLTAFTEVSAHSCPITFFE